MIILILCGCFVLPVSAQTSAQDYPPPQNVPAASTEAELEKAIADYWSCVLASDNSMLEELASVIERTGIEREDPYLQARGLARRAWADIHVGKWNNGARKKLNHARALTAQAPGSGSRRAAYLVARAETVLFHGGLKNVFGLPGKPDGEVDIRDGLALSCQTANNELLFFAHSFAFRSEYLRNRSVSGLFLVVKAEYYAELTKDERYLAAARRLRLLTYQGLMLTGTKEWEDLRKDTLQRFPDMPYVVSAAESALPPNDDTIDEYLGFARSPDSQPDFRFSVDTASKVLNVLLDGEVTDETLGLADAMLRFAKKSQSEHSVFYSAMKKSEVLARLKKDEELFALADTYFPQYMEKRDYFLASRMATVARFRAQGGDDVSRQKEWRSRVGVADGRLRAEAIPQATTAARIAIQQDQSTREAARLQAMYAQEKLVAEQTASKRQQELQASRTTNVYWGALAIVSLLLGTTATLFVRSQTLSSRQAELQREIDVRILAEEKLRKAQQDNIRNHRLNALGEMAAGIAHDVNNCLSPVSTYASLMAMNECSRKQTREFAQTIETCITDAAVLIQRLHPFYRKSFDDRSEVNVAEVVSQVAETLRAQWIGRRIVISEEATPSMFVCSASDIREVLVNLANNAIDAIGKEGHVTLRAALESDRLILEVEDNGVGMNSQTKANCLDTFFSTKEVHGSGLGLATTRAVVESYRGSIEIESELGKGSLFRISLPNESFAETQPTLAENRGTPTECRILLVDDNDATRDSTQFILQANGHHVESYHGAAEALIRLSEEGIDLLLTDYKMPGMNGYELSQKARELYPRMPIVIMSGFEEPGLCEVCDAILAKPFSIADVQDAIFRAGSAHRSTERTGRGDVVEASQEDPARAV